MEKWLNIILRLPIIFILIFLLMQNCCGIHLKGSYLQPTYIHQTILIDSKFSEKETDLIIKATEEWQMKSHNVARYTVIKQYDTTEYYKKPFETNVIVIFKSSKNDGVIKELDAKHKTTILGYFDWTNIGPVIFVVADRLMYATDEYYYGVVVHEFGHALGLKHTDVKGTVMYPTMDHSSNHITQSDINQLCEYFMCWKSDFEKP